MKFTDLCLKRPLTVVLVIVMLILCGGSSIFTMKQEYYPSMALPTILVEAHYSGTSPEDMEKLVTSKLEDSFSSIADLKKIVTNSEEGYCWIEVTFDYGKDMDEAEKDVSQRISQLKSELPDACETPTTYKYDVSSDPVIKLALHGNIAGGVYQYASSKLKPMLTNLAAVSKVDVYGGESDYIEVAVDRNAMTQYGLNFSDISAAIQGSSYTAALGTTRVGFVDMNISAGTEATTFDNMPEITLPLPSGGTIQLKDVASVRMGGAEVKSISKYRENESINVWIYKDAAEDAATVSEQVNTVLSSEFDGNDAIDYDVVYNDADDIRKSLMSVGQTLLLAVFLSMVILFLFLGDIKGSLIVASSMPVSVLAAFLIMNFTNISLNLITLCALIIGVGMMVDNSIVVLESCFRSREAGLSFREAAYQGTKDVIASIAAGTLTTVVVFFPLSLVNGLVGQMFRPLCYVIIFSLIASLLSAISIVPLAYWKYSPQEREKAPLTRAMKWLSNEYRASIAYLLHRKKTVYGVIAILMAVSILSVSQLSASLFASSDSGVINVMINLRSGTPLEEAIEISKEIDEIASAEEDVLDWITNVEGGQSAKVDCSIYLKDERSITTDEYVQVLKDHFNDVTEYTVEISSSSYASAYEESTDYVEITYICNDYETLKNACNTVAEEVRKMPEVSFSSSQFSDGSPSIKILFDPQLCAAYEIDSMSIVSELNNIMNGQHSGELSKDGTQYDIRIKYDGEKYETVNEIKAIQIQAGNGSMIDLADVADVIQMNSANFIYRQDKNYEASVTAYLNDAGSQAAYDKVYESMSSIRIPSGVAIRASAADETMTEEFTSIIKAILLAIFLVFAVMLVQFGSFRSVMMVMICIPFCLVGSFLMLYFTNAEIEMTGLLGFIMLVGTVVNAGILYIDTANKYIESMDRDSALIEAGVMRLRPILMTTMTTIISLIPMAMGIGGNASMLQGFAIVAIGGLTSSTFMSLLMLPTFYCSVLEKDEKRRAKRQAKMEKKQAALGAGSEMM